MAELQFAGEFFLDKCELISSSGVSADISKIIVEINIFEDIFSTIPVEKIHSVSIGAFRMPVNFFKKIEKLYPEEKLFTGSLEKRGSSISYSLEIEQKKKETCKNLLLEHIPREKIFDCETTPDKAV